MCPQTGWLKIEVYLFYPVFPNPRRSLPEFLSITPSAKTLFPHKVTLTGSGCTRLGEALFNLLCWPKPSGDPLAGQSLLSESSTC